MVATFFSVCEEFRDKIIASNSYGLATHLGKSVACCCRALLLLNGWFLAEMYQKIGTLLELKPEVCYKKWENMYAAMRASI